MSRRLRAILLIVACQVACMTLWFSASAAVPNLIHSGAISGQQASLLTGAVQLGYVAGTLTSAAWGLADRFDPRAFFAVSAVVGAAANLLLLLSGFDSAGTVALRFITGMCMAGVYPVGMKLAAGWADRAMGLMIGTLVGALTLGSALPNLFNAIGPVDWRSAIIASSICAIAGAATVCFVGLGPTHRASVKFVAADVMLAMRRRSVRLANFGYLGHMWELYAMWAWIGVFLDWSARRGGAVPAGHVAFDTFLVIASGALGSLVAGALADRVGRTLVTIVAMAISGTCAASIGLLADFGPGVLLLVAIVWGVSVVADSAQFSATIAELSEPRLIGTMLTLQTCLGFLLTFAVIQAMPLVVAALSWRYAFSVLAVGPVFGVLAMWRLRQEPDAERIANGRK